MIGELIADVKTLAASIRRGNAVNVNDRFSKDRSIDLATQYFNDVKPRILPSIGAEELRNHDKLWQQLVQLAHGNNQRQTYIKILASLRKQLSAFNVAALTAPTANKSEVRSGTPTSEEKLIISTLESLVPSAAASYRQAVSDLSKADRVSFRGTAAEFRESLRETLDHLAPDPDVQAQPWFKLEDKQTKPTMKQKTRHVLASRERPKTQRVTAEKTAALVEELSGEVMRAVYDRASLATHVETSRQEVARVKRYVDTLLFDFLEISS